MISIGLSSSSSSFSSLRQYNFKTTSLPQFIVTLPQIQHSAKSKCRIQAYPSDEVSRWEREEQRWLREEQRWLREESRWHAERESLLREISSLKLQIENWERSTSLQPAPDTVANITALLQALKDAELAKSTMELGQTSLGQIAESSGPSPILLEADLSEREQELVVKEIRVVEGEAAERKTVKRATLKKGAEGEDVRLMQEALQKLGFYSGEEDTEFFSFSSGTERAVKTWQASIGFPEDGLMTAELLEILYGEEPAKNATNNSKLAGRVAPEGPTNGAAVASVTEVSEVQERVVKEKGVTEVEVSQHRVFLLGENRWEEPSRLTNRNQHADSSKSKNAATKCPACRGEGSLLCMECDGTGEANIEEQFLEWVDGDAKCPYCDGLGHTPCDMCNGKAVIDVTHKGM